jgi:hypothetical protein
MTRIAASKDFCVTAQYRMSPDRRLLLIAASAVIQKSLPVQIYGDHEQRMPKAF